MIQGGSDHHPRGSSENHWTSERIFFVKNHRPFHSNLDGPIVSKKIATSHNLTKSALNSLLGILLVSFCPHFNTLISLINMTSRLPILENSTLHKTKIHPARLLISLQNFQYSYRTYRVFHMYLNDFVRLFIGHWVT